MTIAAKTKIFPSPLKFFLLKKSDGGGIHSESCIAEEKGCSTSL